VELSEARKAAPQESASQDVVPFNGGFL
jgi:hypothetical protein